MFKEMIIMPVINDFKEFTWSEFVSKGYALHAFVGYIMTDMLSPFLPSIWLVFASALLIGVLYEILMKALKDYTPDWRDARWVLWGSVINFIVHLIFP